MSFAPNYTPSNSFADDETNQAAGRSTVRTVLLDSQFSSISSSINELNANVKKIQRDDDKLKDFIVEPYALSEQTRATMAALGHVPKGPWLINTNYAVGDLVQNLAIAYMCITAHNSGPAFNVGFWMALSGDGSAAGSAIAAQASATSAAASATSATASATSATASATSATASATLATSSALAAQNSADSIAGLAPVNLSAYMLDFLANNNATAARGDLLAAGSVELAATTGATLIGWLRSVTGAVAMPLAKWLGWQPLSVFDFMTDAQIADVQSGAATLDHTTPLQAFRDAVAASGKQRKGVIPAGRYKYSVSPNWAIQDAQIVAEGEVFFRYTGTGNAVIFDADAADAVDPIPGLVYNMRFGVGNKVIVECPATALNAVFVRSVHHSKIGLNVRGAGTTSAGLKVNFAVVTEFDVTVSVNEAGWYLGAKPALGIDLDQRAVNEQTSYCYFPNPIIEGCGTGIQLTNTLGNVFVGGTSEANTSHGVFAPAGASGDRFFGTDFEANTTTDVFSLGNGLEIVDCDGDNIINFGVTAIDCVVKGGRHKSILLETGSLACQALDTTFNRSNNGGTFTDGGTSSVVRNVRNKGAGTQALSGTLAYDPPSIASGSAAQAVVTVTGAKLGDYAVASFSISTGSVSISASVISANTVTVTFDNLSGAAQDLGPGTLKVQVIRQ